ncbi:MAG TPA: Asp-tRNA(Asn)/Glu-tRNA(Gln) amidotransferase GatCAB subunit B, partial [Methylovirgula sp.]|nr:Asp-tRNA(Asn)/Glu-tRNA(Gln) amidotransferase GatCAB subunit B [Methylovirgula sp.]
PYDAGVLVADKETADYYEATVNFGAKRRDPKAVANWIMGDVAAYANSLTLGVSETHLRPAQIAGLVDLITDGTISGKIAKDLLVILINEEKDGDPAAIVEARGMKQVTDLGAIETAVDEIIAANPDKVAQAKAKPSMLGWFVGQVMKQTGGKANPQAVNELLKTKLGI